MGRCVRLGDNGEKLKSMPHSTIKCRCAVVGDDIEKEKCVECRDRLRNEAVGAGSGGDLEITSNILLLLVRSH